MIESKQATRALIYLNNLRHNITLIKKRIGAQVKICLAVKADAYGHGAVQVSQTALTEGVDCLGVSQVSEGAELRAAAVKVKLYLFGLADKQELDDIAGLDLIPFVADMSYLRDLERSGQTQRKKIAVCLKIDTGMGRIGFYPRQVHRAVSYILNSEVLELDGLATHFPIADEGINDFTLKQVEVMNSIVADLLRQKINPGIIHAANSGAIIDYPTSYFSMVRPGISMYGYYPSTMQTRTLALKPVMEFKTKVLFIKRVEAGTGLSYGLSFKTARTTYIATLPVGYADGFNRQLSNKGQVIIKDRRYPVVGRVCMDQCLVDLGPQTDVQKFDDVTLFGPGPVTAEDLALNLGTIPYEVTCWIGKRVPRVYIE